MPKSVGVQRDETERADRADRSGPTAQAEVDAPTNGSRPSETGVTI